MIASWTIRIHVHGGDEDRWLHLGSLAPTLMTWHSCEGGGSQCNSSTQYLVRPELRWKIC